MTEKAINERAIYEWLGYKFDTDGTARFREMYEWLPPLDMNLAFGQCIPKLAAEGVTVIYHGIDCHVVQPEKVLLWVLIDERGGISGADFYAALLAYIRGVK